MHEGPHGIGLVLPLGIVELQETEAGAEAGTVQCQFADMFKVVVGMVERIRDCRNLQESKREDQGESNLLLRGHL